MPGAQIVTDTNGILTLPPPAAGPSSMMIDATLVADAEDDEDDELDEDDEEEDEDDEDELDDDETDEPPLL